MPKKGKEGLLFPGLLLPFVYSVVLLVSIKAYSQLLYLVSRMMMCFVTPGQERCWDVKRWLE